MRRSSPSCSTRCSRRSSGAQRSPVVVVRRLWVSSGGIRRCAALLSGGGIRRWRPQMVPAGGVRRRCAASLSGGGIRRWCPPHRVGPAVLPGVPAAVLLTTELVDRCQIARSSTSYEVGKRMPATELVREAAYMVGRCMFCSKGAWTVGVRSEGAWTVGARTADAWTAVQGPVSARVGVGIGRDRELSRYRHRRHRDVPRSGVGPAVGGLTPSRRRPCGPRRHPFTAPAASPCT